MVKRITLLILLVTATAAVFPNPADAYGRRGSYGGSSGWPGYWYGGYRRGSGWTPFSGPDRSNCVEFNRPVVRHGVVIMQQVYSCR